MKRSQSLPILSLFFAAAIFAKAEPNSTTPAKPQEPITLRAPDNAVWKVTTVFKTQAPAKSGKQKKKKDAQMNVRTMQKRGNVIQEKMLLNGREYESYIVGDRRVGDEGNKGTVSIISSNDWTYPEYGDVDFDRLRWVDISNYTGVQEYKGRKVFVFKIAGDQKKLNRLQTSMLEYSKRNPGNPKPLFLSDSVAMFDVETQLPVFYSDAELTETYEFLPLRNTTFTVPDKFKAALRMTDEQLYPPASKP